MNKEKNHIDDFVGGAAKGYSEAPPGYAWKNLSESLDAKKKRRVVAYFSWAATIAGIIIAFSIGYFVSNNSTSKVQVITQNEGNQTSVFSPQSSNISQKSASNTNTSANQNTKSLKSEVKTNKSPFATHEKQQYSNKNSQSINSIQPTIKTIQLIDSIDTNPVSTIKNSLSSVENPVSVTQPNDSKKKVKNDTLIDPLQLNTIKPTIAEFEIQTKEPEKKKNKSRWSLGAGVSPVYAFRNSGGNFEKKDTYVFNSPVTSLGVNNSEEAGIMTYSAGFNTSYSLSKRWNILSGLFYTRFGQETGAFSFQQESENSFVSGTSAGYIYSSEVEEIGSSQNLGGAYLYDESNTRLLQNFDYLEIPMMMQFKFIDRKIDVFVSGGLNTFLLVNNNSYIQEGNNKSEIGQTDNLRSVVYGGLFGLGTEFPVSNQIYFNIEPLYKQTFSTISKNSGIRFKPYSVGVLTGLKYKL
jgi:hypothetical protein